MLPKTMAVSKNNTNILQRYAPNMPASVIGTGARPTQPNPQVDKKVVKAVGRSLFSAAGGKPTEAKKEAAAVETKRRIVDPDTFTVTAKQKTAARQNAAGASETSRPFANRLEALKTPAKAPLLPAKSAEKTDSFLKSWQALAKFVPESAHKKQTTQALEELKQNTQPPVVRPQRRSTRQLDYATTPCLKQRHKIQQMKDLMESRMHRDLLQPSPRPLNTSPATATNQVTTFNALASANLNTGDKGGIQPRPLRMQLVPLSVPQLSKLLELPSKTKEIKESTGLRVVSAFEGSGNEEKTRLRPLPLPKGVPPSIATIKEESEEDLLHTPVLRVQIPGRSAFDKQKMQAELRKQTRLPTAAGEEKELPQIPGSAAVVVRRLRSSV